MPTSFDGPPPSPLHQPPLPSLEFTGSWGEQFLAQWPLPTSSRGNTLCFSVKGFSLIQKVFGVCSVCVLWEAWESQELNNFRVSTHPMRESSSWINAQLPSGRGRSRKLLCGSSEGPQGDWAPDVPKGKLLAYMPRINWPFSPPLLPLLFPHRSWDRLPPKMTCPKLSQGLLWENLNRTLVPFNSSIFSALLDTNQC